MWSITHEYSAAGEHDCDQYSFLSNYLHVNKQINLKLCQYLDEISERMAAHKLSGQCHKKHLGSSVDWRRHVHLTCGTDQNKLIACVTQLFSSAHMAVRDTEPYDPVRQIEQQECVNHVARRLTSQLNNLKQWTTVPKQTKKGKTLQARWEERTSSLKKVLKKCPSISVKT